MTSLKKLAALIGAGALVFAMAGTAAAVADYATVSSHEAFSADANQASYWGEDCEKIDAVDDNLGDAYVLTADYGKVIVKAGAGTYANTIFDNPTSGQTVWADTNGDSVYNPGGQDGDKNISHIIFCDPTTTTTTTTTTDETTTTTTTDETTTTTTTDETTTTTTTTDTFTSDTGGETDAPTLPNTATVGTNGTGAPADGAWLLVIALGVLLASIVVLTPAKAGTRR
ncbi:MAG: hypothetical protein ABI620_04645 [Chloroflexota bacterium]